MSIRKHSARPPFVRFVQCVLGLALLVAPMFALLAASDARAQTTDTAIYGVTALDVAPGAASQGVALLKQYRDGALKQAGNMGVTLLQEVAKRRSIRRLRVQKGDDLVVATQGRVGS